MVTSCKISSSLIKDTDPSVRIVTTPPARWPLCSLGLLLNMWKKTSVWAETFNLVSLHQAADAELNFEFSSVLLRDFFLFQFTLR